MSYQHSQSGWGSPQYQFGLPPPLNFQPQPTWTGMDFYRAHALTPDPALFNHAWSRVRDHSNMSGGEIAGLGVGLHEASHWHRRAYGGVGEVSRMLPAEIGHAAAYEAYRNWIHNRPIYEPLGHDVHRQREVLIGLAVAEATRLLSHAGRQMDHYVSTSTSEAAAATASIIFFQSREDIDDGYRRSRSRSRYGPSHSFDEPYDGNPSYSGYRSHSRHRSRSHSRHPSVPVVPVGSARSYSGNGYTTPRYPAPMPPGIASSFGGQSSSYGSFGGSRIPVPVHGIPYTPSALPLVHGSSHQTPMVPLTSSHRGRSPSVSYVQDPYMGAAMSAGTVLIPQPQPILISEPHRRHKHHRHHHRSHSRPRSIRSRSLGPAHYHRH